MRSRSQLWISSSPKNNSICVGNDLPLQDGKAPHGDGDLEFLRRSSRKPMLNFSWWVISILMPKYLVKVYAEPDDPRRGDYSL
jgi:hypothetical protein